MLRPMPRKNRCCLGSVTLAGGKSYRDPQQGVVTARQAGSPACGRLSLPAGIGRRSADLAYQGAGPWLTTGIKRRPLQELTPTERTLNEAPAAARAPVERGVARLKSCTRRPRRAIT
jgi:hypothetical protein